MQQQLLAKQHAIIQTCAVGINGFNVVLYVPRSRPHVKSVTNYRKMVTKINWCYAGCLDNGIDHYLQTD